MTTVVNFLDVKQHFNARAGTWDSPDYVYIGRKNQRYGLPESKWANPVRLHVDTAEARMEGQALYRVHVMESGLIECIHELDGKTLVCWCRGKKNGHLCHGDVLLEFLGVKAVEAVVPSTSQMSIGGGQPCILAWDKGRAGYQIGQSKHGELYRTSERIGPQIGEAGKVYTDWMTHRRDYLKFILRVKGGTLTMSRTEYARYRYETSLQAMENETDAVARLHRDVLRELLAELDEDK